MCLWKNSKTEVDCFLIPVLDGAFFKFNFFSTESFSTIDWELVQAYVLWVYKTLYWFYEYKKKKWHNLLSKKENAL